MGDRLPWIPAKLADSAQICSGGTLQGEGWQSTIDRPWHAVCSTSTDDSWTSTTRRFRTGSSRIPRWSLAATQFAAGLWRLARRFIRGSIAAPSSAAGSSLHSKQNRPRGSRHHQSISSPYSSYRPLDTRRRFCNRTRTGRISRFAGTASPAGNESRPADGGRSSSSGLCTRVRSRLERSFARRRILSSRATSSARINVGDSASSHPAALCRSLANNKSIPFSILSSVLQSSVLSSPVHQVFRPQFSKER